MPVLDSSLNHEPKPFGVMETHSPDNGDQAWKNHTKRWWHDPVCQGGLATLMSFILQSVTIGIFAVRQGMLESSIPTIAVLGALHLIPAALLVFRRGLISGSWLVLFTGFQTVGTVQAAYEGVSGVDARSIAVQMIILTLVIRATWVAWRQSTH